MTFISLTFLASLSALPLASKLVLVLFVCLLAAPHWIIIFDYDPGVEFPTLDVLEFLSFHYVFETSFVTISFQFF